jgi:hypothetical protein
MEAEMDKKAIAGIGIIAVGGIAVFMLSRSGDGGSMPGGGGGGAPPPATFQSLISHRCQTRWIITISLVEDIKDLEDPLKRNKQLLIYQVETRLLSWSLEFGKKEENQENY